MIWPFSRKPQPKKTPVKYRRGDAGFRDHDDLVNWSKRTFLSSEGQALEAFLFSGIPQSIFYRGDKITTEQAALEYMRIVGYMECLAKLQESTVPIPLPLPDVPAEYPDPEPEPDETMSE